MADFVAVKKLTKTDLSYFEPQFRALKGKGGKQKGININADVFVEQFYPALSARTTNNLPVELSVYGPGLKPLQRDVRRKITRGAAKAGGSTGYKNWRLNGVLWPNPPSDPTRYDSLKPGDYAVLAFHGDPRPTGVEMFLVTAKGSEDAYLHAALTVAVGPMSGSKTMVVLDPAKLKACVEAKGVPTAHPLRLLIDDPSLKIEFEEASLGSSEAVTSIMKRGRTPRFTAADHAKAKANADRVGREGERLVLAHLESQLGTKWAEVTWAADANAVSPFDFRCRTLSGETVLIDAKSTEGPFDRRLHISMAEVLTAADKAGGRYDIYRVFEIDGLGAKLRIAENIADQAQRIIDGLAGLPAGVKPDGFTLEAGYLTWGASITLTNPVPAAEAPSGDAKEPELAL